MRVVCSWFCVVFEGDVGCSCKRKRRLGIQGTRIARGDAATSIGWCPKIGFRAWNSPETFHLLNKLAISTNKEL